MFDDILDNIVRRVVRAGGLAFSLVVFQEELLAFFFIIGLPQVKFQQSLVDRPELFHIQRFIVDKRFASRCIDCDFAGKQFKGRHQKPVGDLIPNYASRNLLLSKAKLKSCVKRILIRCANDFNL